MTCIGSKTKLLSSSLVLGLTLVVSPVAVFAMRSGDDTSGSSSSSNSGSSQSGSSASTGETTTNLTEPVEASDDKGTGTLRARAQQLLDDKRAQVKGHTTAQRQKACTSHETTIDNRFTTLGSKAQLYLDRYNTVFTKVQAYQTKHQLSVNNYDTLVADTTAKQTAATTAVATLKNLAGTKIDCTATDSASTVADVKTAANDARTALQAYRSSLKSLIQALLDAQKTTSTNTTEGSN